MLRTSRPRGAVRGATWNDPLYASAHATYNQFDLRLPTIGRPPYPLNVAIHAGGWDSGSKDLAPTHVSFGVLAQGIAHASIAYRLSTAAAWPKQIHDVRAAIRHFRANAPRYQIDPARVSVWGFSAGAFLAVLLASSPDEATLTDLAMGNAGVSDRVACAAAYSAPIYFPDEDAQLIANGFSARACGTTSNEARLLGGDPNTGNVNPCTGAGLTLSGQASPQTYVGAGAAPMRLEVGTLDTTVPYQQSRNFRDLCVTRGVACQYVEHVGEGHTSFWTNTAIGDATIAWLKAQLAA